MEVFAKLRLTLRKDKNIDKLNNFSANFVELNWKFICTRDLRYYLDSRPDM